MTSTAVAEWIHEMVGAAAGEPKKTTGNRPDHDFGPKRPGVLTTFRLCLVDRGSIPKLTQQRPYSIHAYLILKLVTPKKALSPTDFSPISLVHSFAKLVTKVMPNRLAPMLKI